MARKNKMRGKNGHRTGSVNFASGKKEASEHLIEKNGNWPIKRRGHCYCMAIEIFRKPRAESTNAWDECLRMWKAKRVDNVNNSTSQTLLRALVKSRPRLFAFEGWTLISPTCSSTQSNNHNNKNWKKKESQERHEWNWYNFVYQF